MGSKQSKSLYGIIFVGVMAAMVFVTTSFLKIQIPTPAGPTMLKVGNVVCLLGGMMFGGVYGGLAAGIGSMLFDLTNPAFAPSAPFTLVFFFIMSFVCGTIANWGDKDGLDARQNIIGAVCGATSYWILNIGKSIILLMLAGSTFQAAWIANAAKMITSGINAVIAVVFSVLLAKPLVKALQAAGMMDKIDKHPLRKLFKK